MSKRRSEQEFTTSTSLMDYFYLPQKWYKTFNHKLMANRTLICN